MLAAGAAAPSGQKGRSIPMSPNQDQAGQTPALMPSVSCSYIFSSSINMYFMRNVVMAILPGQKSAIIKSCSYLFFCSTNVYLIKNINKAKDVLMASPPPLGHAVMTSKSCSYIYFLLNKFISN